MTSRPGQRLTAWTSAGSALYGADFCQVSASQRGLLPGQRSTARTSAGSGEGGALAVLGEGIVPVAVAVVEGHVHVGAGVLDDVADLRVVVEPAGVRGAHAGAAVGHVRVALIGHRPRGRVQELTGVGQAHRVLYVLDVVAERAVRVDADRLGVHRVEAVLLDDHLGARPGGEARHPGGDGDRPGQVTVVEHTELVGLDVDLVHVRVADVERRRAVELAVDAVAGGDPVDVGVHGDLRPGLPVRRGPPVHLVVGEPVP